MKPRRAHLDTEVVEDVLDEVGRRWGVTVLKIDRRPHHFEAVLTSKTSGHLVRFTLTPGRRDGDVDVIAQEEVPEEFRSWMRTVHRFKVTTALEELSSLLDSLMKPIVKDWSLDARLSSRASCVDLVRYLEGDDMPKNPPSQPPPDEWLDALPTGTILHGKKGKKSRVVKKRSNGNWDVYLKDPKKVADDPYLRGVDENKTNMAVNGLMGKSYKWSVYSKTASLSPGEGNTMPSLRQDLLKLAHDNPDGIRKHLVGVLRGKSAGGWEDKALVQVGKELGESHEDFTWKKDSEYKDAILVDVGGSSPVMVFRDMRAAKAAATEAVTKDMREDPGGFDARWIEPFLSVGKQQATNAAYEYAFEFIVSSVQGTMSDRELERNMDKAGLDWDEDQIEEDRDGAEDALLDQLMKDWADDMGRDPVRWYEEHRGELFMSEIPSWMDFDVEGAAEEYVDSNGPGESLHIRGGEVELDGGAVLIEE